MTRIIRSYEHGTGEILDYGFDWAGDADDGGPYLESADTIESSTWTVETGLTEVNDSDHPTQSTDTTTKIWISAAAATVNTTYVITNTIVTDDGRTAERSIAITVVDR